MDAPRVLSYSRVSCRLQLDGGGLERQMDMARRWCAQNGCQLDEELELVDPGRSAYSGAHLKGALGQLLYLFANGELQEGTVILIEAIDRLSRQEPLDALQQVFLALVQAGAVLVDLEDGQLYSRQTLNTDQLALIKLALKVGAAHDYSKRLSRRIGRHWEQVRDRYRQGDPLARGGNGGRRPFWVQLSADRQRWELNQSAETVRFIFELAQSRGVTSIAKALNAKGLPTATGNRWTASSVRRVLYDPAACGDQALGRRARANALAELRRWERNPKGTPPVIPPEVEVIADFWPPVVSQEMFERTQRLLLERQFNAAAKAPETPMACFVQGLVFCEAGGAMSACSSKPAGNSKRYIYLRCRRRRFGAGCTCAGKGWKLKDLEAHLISRFSVGLLALVSAQVQGRQEQLDQLQREYERAAARVASCAKSLKAAQRSLEEAVDQSASVALLERLSGIEEARKAELRQAEGVANAALDSMTRLQAQPSILAALNPGQESQLAIARGESTPEQRKAINETLKQVGARIVLDGSIQEQPRIGISLSGGEPNWQAYLKGKERILAAATWGWKSAEEMEEALAGYKPKDACEAAEIQSLLKLPLVANPSRIEVINGRASARLVEPREAI
ncbi:MAG: recombinase family protein [Cyanobacteriota bacterium]